IPVPLQDRMEIIRLPGYTEQEKIQIAKKYLIPKEREAHGLTEANLELAESATKGIIRQYTREAGVRNLEREIAKIARKVAREVADKGKEKKVNVTSKSLEKYLGVFHFRFGVMEEEDQIGMTNGLAWTEFGGELLTTEVTIMPGRGKLTITGKLGDVMQESAQAALSYVRSRAEDMGLSRNFYQRLDIHIHVPEGAVPKDGPSAGVTMATTLTSALLRIPVRKDIAMTGEITLRGRVLPIGGLKEKSLAAHRAGIKTIIVPKENEKDLKEIPQNILKDLKFICVEHMDEVLKNALVLKDPDSLFKRKGEVVEEEYPVPVDPSSPADPKKRPSSAGGVVTH
ncbi:MAG: S16 family serine protease, partial [bacterium]|nr:S16 family serine protease [bacterium]